MARNTIKIFDAVKNGNLDELKECIESLGGKALLSEDAL